MEEKEELKQSETAPEKPKRKRKPTAEKMMRDGEKISENIVLCSDGKYRWIYEMSLLKNPSIFILVYKIFFFIFLAIFAGVFFFGAVGTKDYFPDRLTEDLRFLLYFILGMTAVIILGYLLFAAIMGGKYCVMFEMDKDGVNHKAVPAQAKKAKALSKATVIGGLATGRFSTVAIGNAAARTEMYTDFKSVTAVIPKRMFHIIKVNSGLFHNQVYAADTDFEFVWDYIIAHCGNKLKKPKRN